MKTPTWILGLALLGALPAGARPIDTASCDGKRGWQRQIVREAVAHWLDATVDPGDLVALVQAEHGIVACSPGRLPRGLHTTTLPAGLRPAQLGGSPAGPAAVPREGPGQNPARLPPRGRGGGPCAGRWCTLRAIDRISARGGGGGRS